MSQNTTQAARPAPIETGRLDLSSFEVAYIADYAARDGITFDRAMEAVLRTGIACLRGFVPEVEDEEASRKCAQCEFQRTAERNGNEFFFCAGRGFHVYEEVVNMTRRCDAFVAAQVESEGGHE